MSRIGLFCSVAFALALAIVACGGDSNKPPLTPDTDKPAELVDAGSTISPTPVPAKPVVPSK